VPSWHRIVFDEVSLYILRKMLCIFLKLEIFDF